MSSIGHARSVSHLREKVARVLVRADLAGIATRSFPVALETYPKPGLVSLVDPGVADLLAVTLLFDAVERAA